MLAVTANSLTTKINTTESDKYGRWTKTFCFAKNGSFSIYSVYRPNPGSLKTLGANSTWMQQYRAFCKGDATVDTRFKLIEDLIIDVKSEQAMGGKILIAGDFNEDPRDDKKDGNKKISRSMFPTKCFSGHQGPYAQY